MPRVVMVSPHFPPDTSAATHRVRLLAPHLPRYGWEPVVVTVDPRDYGTRLDPGLAGLVDPGLRVVRARAWSRRWTQRLGVGDLGLRALTGLHAACADLMRREQVDALFVTIFPAYAALLGPWLKRRFGVPFVLDYQDPWIGAWGLTVGGRPDGGPDWKSRLSRWAGVVLEPVAARAADAITAVSRGTFEPIQARYPALRDVPCAEIPIGGEPADFERVRALGRPNPYFDPADGDLHLCHVGTLLPLGGETLRAVLEAVGTLRTGRPDLYRRLRLHFFGSSNQTSADAPARALPVARELGVADRVTEHPARIDYLDALGVQTQASGILMLGSSERHYTASKLYPGLLARRPVLAVYHEASSVTALVRRIARPPAVRLVTYDDQARAGSRVAGLAAELVALADTPGYDPACVDTAALAEVSAERLAGRLAAVLDGARRRARAARPAPAGAGIRS